MAEAVAAAAYPVAVHLRRGDYCRPENAIPPVLPVQQGDALAAAQAQCAGERVNKHLIAKAPGQFSVDHARAPNLSYSCSMRRAAVFSS